MKRYSIYSLALMVLVSFVLVLSPSAFVYAGGGGGGGDDGGGDGGGGDPEPPPPPPPPPPPEIPPNMAPGYVIQSVGTYKGVSRVIVLEGARSSTWAKYALWSNNNRTIYYKGGEKFSGPVHSNTKAYFDGNPEFFSDCTTAASTYGGNIDDVIFHTPFEMGVPEESMADVNFDSMKDNATHTVTGETAVILVGSNILITNGGETTTNAMVENMLIYVESKPSSAQHGNVDVSGELDGQLTIVADEQINIIDNITYADDPTVGPSDDVLGLIAKSNILVKEEFPDDGEIYAHMMATGQWTPGDPDDGWFGVENYHSRDPSGELNVHGGIVQDYRGAVGTFYTGGGTLASGFDKNYTYDSRLTENAPPCYPRLSDSMGWDKWRERNL